MIQLRDVSGKTFYLNCEMIYRIDSHYDTIITLNDQKKVIVMDSAEEVVEKAISYKRKIYADWEAKS